MSSARSRSRAARAYRVAVELGPVERFGARGTGTSLTSVTRTVAPPDDGGWGILEP
ncbi:hypothetical protein [Pendulispora albinea]|uniref:Uncharacterized protein n=1 Tax=Pendulispora albinea TaxID=2741071 RepID=A0ABZ2LKU0_9BACT